MYTDLMIDFETLSSRPDAMILSFGAVLFVADQDEHDYPRKKFYEKPSMKSQQRIGMHIEPNTVRWWLRQSGDARAEFYSDNDLYLNDLGTVLLAFNDFIGVHPPKRIWSHGATFDLPILQLLYSRSGLDLPFKYWDCRDTRTLFDLAGNDPTLKGLLKPKGITAHNAVIDCENQANAVNYAWRKLKGGL